MNKLNDWIEYGRTDGIFGSKRKVRRWLNEARARVPVIDRVNFPDSGYDRRIVCRARVNNGNAT